MTSLADIDRLLRFGDWRLRRHEALLLGLRQRRVRVQRELSALDEQEASLLALLGSHRVEDAVLEHWQLLESLRRQAVIRRQIQILLLERQPLREQRVQLDQDVGERQQALELMQRKQSGYAALRQRLRRQVRLERVRRDEGEIDELIGVKR